LALETISSVRALLRPDSRVTPIRGYLDTRCLPKQAAGFSLSNRLLGTEVGRFALLPRPELRPAGSGPRDFLQAAGLFLLKDVE